MEAVENIIENPELEEELLNLQNEQRQLQNKIDEENDKVFQVRNLIALIKEKEVHYLHQMKVLQSDKDFALCRLKERVHQLEQDYLSLKKKSDLELIKDDEEIDKLQKELELLSKVDSVDNDGENDNLNSSVIYEENMILENEIEILNEELFEKQFNLNQLQTQNVKLSECRKDSQIELDQLNENINCKKENLTETNDLINTLEDELFTLKQELDTLKFECKKQSDTENSLFAEVNNKRLKYQEILVDLTQKCDRMKLEVTNKQRQICALRLHNDELTNIVINDEAEYKIDQKMVIEAYHSRISTLKKLVEKYKNIMREIQHLDSIGLPNNVVQFLNYIIEEKKKNEESLNEEIGMEFRVKKMVSLQLKEGYLKLQEWKDSAEQIKNKYLEHNKTIQKLKQREEDDSVLVETSKQSSNICRKKRKSSIISVDDEDQENVIPSSNENQMVAKAVEKKVTFSEDTKTTSDNRIARRGGRIIQTKSVHISSLTKNN